MCLNNSFFDSLLIRLHLLSVSIIQCLKHLNYLCVFNGEVQMLWEKHCSRALSLANSCGHALDVEEEHGESF